MKGENNPSLRVEKAVETPHRIVRFVKSDSPMCVFFQFTEISRIVRFLCRTVRSVEISRFEEWIGLSGLGVG